MEPIFGRIYGPPPKRRRGGRMALLAGALVAGTALWFFFARDFRPAVLEPWVASPGFNTMLSKAVSKALKVDGAFGPLRLDSGFSVTTSGFTSAGWPGQAIGRLDAGEATGTFNPWAVFRGRWQVDLIALESADFRLVQPDDALKGEDPVSPPPPWFAFLMPREFHCGWIDCAAMRIELPLGGVTVTGDRLRVGAMMIGKNFKYFGRDGLLRFPGYPDLAVDGLEVYVTRDFINIGYLFLRQPDSARSNLKVSGRMGQHEDKSLYTEAELTSLDISPFLPGELAAILQGRLSGRVSYRTDVDGGNAAGEGSLSLADAVIGNWDYLYGLAKRSANPSLGEARFRDVSLSYNLAGGVFTVSDLSVLGREHFELSGRGSWEIATSQASAQIAVKRIPVEAYLPDSLAGHVLGGELGGSVDWKWRGTHVGEGRGSGTLHLGGALLRDFKFQQFLARFLKSAAYDTIAVDNARAAWKQDEAGLSVWDLDALAPGQAGLRGWVHAGPDGTLSGTVMAGLPASALEWLPDATSSVFAVEDQGLHWCTIKLWGTVDKPENDFTQQAMRQLRKHPIALSRLALRGLSWWLGDVLGKERRP